MFDEFEKILDQQEILIDSVEQDNKEFYPSDSIHTKIQDFILKIILTFCFRSSFFSETKDYSRYISADSVGSKVPYQSENPLSTKFSNSHRTQSTF